MANCCSACIICDTKGVKSETSAASTRNCPSRPESWRATVGDLALATTGAGWGGETKGGGGGGGDNGVKVRKGPVAKAKCEGKGGPPLLFDDMAPVEQRTDKLFFYSKIHQFHLRSTLRSEHLTSELWHVSSSALWLLLPYGCFVMWRLRVNILQWKCLLRRCDFFRYTRSVNGFRESVGSPLGIRENARS